MTRILDQRCGSEGLRADDYVGDGTLDLTFWSWLHEGWLPFA